MANKLVDLTGQKFSHLLVIERVINKATQVTMWRCFCDCGKEKIVSGQNLKSGGVQSCGCLTTLIDLSNQRFGFLVVSHKKQRKVGHKGNVMWVCKCDCGNEIITSSAQLKNGEIISCGCHRKKAHLLPELISTLEEMVDWIEIDLKKSFPPALLSYSSSLIDHPISKAKQLLIKAKTNI